MIWEEPQQLLQVARGESAKKEELSRQGDFQTFNPDCSSGQIYRSCDFGHSIANSSAVSENVAFKTKYSAGEHHEKEARMPDGKLHLLILQILCPSFPPAVRRAGCAQG